MIAAGGTGGHLFPAIAVADELKKINDEIDILFVGAKGKMEEKVVPKTGYKLRTIEIAGFSRTWSLKNIGVFFKLRRAIKESKKYLEEFAPEIVFGTGGFVSGPVLWAASRLGIPTVVQEGNYYPGLTVKILSSKVDRVIINFEGSKKYFKKLDNVEIMPYPVRENLTKYSKEDSCGYFKLDTNKKILFVLGGSQGASSINKVILKNLDSLVNQNIQVIWQTGQNDYTEIAEKVKKYSGIKPLVFIENIDYAYSAADIILCRSGISTVMELAYFGAAAIFIPFAFASENHQEKNARALVNANAAEIILDSNLESHFIDKVISLIKDENRLSELRTNIMKFADRNAATKIANLLTELSNIHLN